MKVIIPTPLRSYTKEKSEVVASGKTLADALADLDYRFPGIRFRIIDEQNQIRPHIKIFVNQEEGELRTSLSANDQIQIVCSLSGG